MVICAFTVKLAGIGHIDRSKACAIRPHCWFAGLRAALAMSTLQSKSGATIISPFGLAPKALGILHDHTGPASRHAFQCRKLPGILGNAGCKDATRARASVTENVALLFSVSVILFKAGGGIRSHSIRAGSPRSVGYIRASIPIRPSDSWYRKSPCPAESPCPLSRNCRARRSLEASHRRRPGSAGRVLVLRLFGRTGADVGRLFGDRADIRAIPAFRPAVRHLS